MQSTTEVTVSRMLVIGDPHGISEILQRFAADPQWQTDFAGRWGDAATRLRKTRYDVVLVYVGINGPPELVVIRRLRLIDPDVKIIFFVEQATTDQVLAAIRAHAFSYFSAPFDI